MSSWFRQILKKEEDAKLLLCAPQGYSADLLASALGAAGLKPTELMRLADPRHPPVQMKEVVALHQSSPLHRSAWLYCNGLGCKLHHLINEYRYICLITSEGDISYNPARGGQAWPTVAISLVAYLLIGTW